MSYLLANSFFDIPMTIGHSTERKPTAIITAEKQ
jgi:hypothetical protein